MRLVCAQDSFPEAGTRGCEKAIIALAVTRTAVLRMCQIWAASHPVLACLCRCTCSVGIMRHRKSTPCKCSGGCADIGGLRCCRHRLRGLGVVLWLSQIRLSDGVQGAVQSWRGNAHFPGNECGV